MIRISQQAGREDSADRHEHSAQLRPGLHARPSTALFVELAARHQLPLVPFFLDGIALDEALMQEDGLHPTAAAQPTLLETVWPKLEPLLKRSDPTLFLRTACR